MAADEAAALPTHGRMLRYTALACLAAMASALTPAAMTPAAKRPEQIPAESHLRSSQAV